nr:unnamed protein product [Digitaria exilis]
MRPPRRAALALGLCCLVALAARGADASIHEYGGGGFAPRANSFFFHGGSEGLYASDPSSNSSASFIRYALPPPPPPPPPPPFDSVVFRRTPEAASRHDDMQQKTGLVEAIIVEIQDRDKIGGSYLHSDAICCTPELDKEKYCKFVRCWKDILQLHYHITAVIALGMCEMAFWYFEYANFNSTGTRPMGITLWAVTFTAVKKTVSRLLLLVVSMGYGVVLPTLGGITSKVYALGFIYFVASEALELVENLGNINDFSGKTRFSYSEDAGEGADEEGLSLVGSAVKGTGDMVNMHIFPEDKRA